MQAAKVVLLCSANRKTAHPAPAITLYRSEFFRLGRSYAQSFSPQAIFVLSARWGLVPADHILAPYPETMSSFETSQAIQVWADEIVHSLHHNLSVDRSHIVVLGLRKFAYPIATQLPHASMPLDGMNYVQALNYLRSYPME